VCTSFGCFHTVTRKLSVSLCVFRAAAVERKWDYDSLSLRKISPKSLPTLPLLSDKYKLENDQKPTSVSECRFGYPLYWPDVCIKKIYCISPFQYLRLKNFVERATIAKPWFDQNVPVSECYSAQTSSFPQRDYKSRTEYIRFNGFGKGNFTLLL
jgi:hypothetical protein